MKNHDLSIKEGDANSKFFHNVMSYRKTRNSIHLVHVHGVLVEGVQNIRMKVFDHFATHYRVHDVHRPGIEGLNFRKLTVTQGGGLIRPFSLKRAIWDCESYKSPGPDGINFGFIKEF